MFWRFGFQTASALDSLFDKQGVTLEEILDEADLLQECKAKNQKLVDFLSNLDIAKRLLAYVSQAHLVSIPESQEQGYTPTSVSTGADIDNVVRTSNEQQANTNVLQSTNEESVSTAAVIAQKEKLLIKYPYLVTEIFSADIHAIYDVVLNNTETFSDFASSLFNHSTAVNPIQATYWAKIMCNFLIKRTKETMTILKLIPSFIPKLIHIAIDSPSLMDLLLKFVGIEELEEGRIEQSIQWLASQNMVTMLVEYLHPKYSREIHTNVSSALLDIIAMIQALSVNGNNMEDSPLIKAIKSEDTTSKLLGFMLEVKVGNVSSTLVNGISIFVELIQRNSCELRDVYQKRSVENNSYVAAPANASIGNASMPMDLSDMTRMLCLYLPGLQLCLVQPTPASRQLDSTLGKITPLGQDRLRVCELIAELLRSTIEDWILDGLNPVTPSISLAPLAAIPVEHNKEPDERISAVDQNSALLTIGSANTSYNVADRKNISTEASQGDQYTKGDKVSPTRTIDSTTVSFSNELSKFPPKVQASAIHSRNEQRESLRRLMGADLQLALRDILVETRIIVTCMDLFFSFPWNNLLHGIVYDIILQILNGPHSKCKPLVLSVLRDGHLTKRLTQAQRLSDYQSELPRGARLGYMGHVILIAEEVVKVVDREIYLRRELEDLLRLEEWQEFSTRILHETLERDRKPLGGGKPSSPTGYNVSATNYDLTAEDDDVVADVASGDMATDQFARYLCQQITSDLPDKFGISEENDDDDDQDTNVSEWNAFGGFVQSPFDNDEVSSTQRNPIMPQQSNTVTHDSDSDESGHELPPILGGSIAGNSILSDNTWTADFMGAFERNEFDAIDATTPSHEPATSTPSISEEHAKNGSV